MAIVKMNKFTLLAFESKKSKLLEELQNFANAEFINLQNEEVIDNLEEFKGLEKDKIDSKCAKDEEDLSKVKFALEFLKKYAPKKKGLKAFEEDKQVLSIDEIINKVKTSNWEEIYEKVKNKEKEILSLEAKETKLKGEIEILSPWKNLDVGFGQLEELNNVSYLLGSISKQYTENMEEVLNNEIPNGVYVEIISSTSNDANILAIANKENEEKLLEVFRGFGFSSFKTEQKEVPFKIITDYENEIGEIHSRKFLLKEELACFDKELKLLEIVYEYYQDKVNREKSTSNFLKTKNMVTIQGWNPVATNEELSNICNKILGEDYYLVFEDVKEEDISNVPIKLENGSVVSAFEGVTEMYALPKYDEIDPTPLLMPFYFLFFGMMVADVGYGVLMMLVTLFALNKMKLSDSNKKMVKFFFYLGVSTTFFGVIYGSALGMKFPSLIDTDRDMMTIMILSLVFGVIQILTGLFIKAYMLIRDGKPWDAFLDVGSWLIMLFSIGLFGAQVYLGLPTVFKTIGIAGMVIGSLLIIYAGGRFEKSTGAKIGQGAYTLYGITSYVSDIVSYTRLMALGLAGGSIGAAINMIIGTMPIVAIIVFGPLIFIFGHIFNLGLGLLGAYVHTARLQYIEYFGKFYEGGGKQFKPFKNQEKYIEIKK